MKLTKSCGVVNCHVKGFNKNGERNIKMLNNNNVVKGKRTIASKISALIIKHKKLWIDKTIKVRDDLIHPDKIFKMAMFELILKNDNDEISIQYVKLPIIGRKPLVDTLDQLLGKINRFSRDYLLLLKMTV